MKRLFVTLLASGALVASFAVAANAGSGRVLATPANACSELVKWEAGGYTSFGDCMGQINQDVKAFRFDEEGTLLSLEQRCAGFESEFLTYPFLFVEPEGWPFETFTAQNRQQCEYTLFTYHTLTAGG